MVVELCMTVLLFGVTAAVMAFFIRPSVWASVSNRVVAVILVGGLSGAGFGVFGSIFSSSLLVMFGTMCGGTLIVVGMMFIPTILRLYEN